jgi:F-type H+-transporting ATPase subunit epsilon
MAELKCVIVTPERAVLDDSADFVALPMYDGELGVLPGRAPLIGRLGPGQLRVRRGAETSYYFIDGGFAQVRANVVTVLTPRAQKANEIDATAARKTLEEAQKPVAGEAALTAARKNQDRARAQLRVAANAPRPTASGA